MTYFHLECQNPIKNIKLCPIFPPMSLILLSKPLKCIFLINKINLMSLLMHSFYEKIQDSNINSTKFGDLSYKKIMPSYITYFMLFVVKIWSNLNKYC